MVFLDLRKLGGTWPFLELQGIHNQITWCLNMYDWNDVDINHLCYLAQKELHFKKPNQPLNESNACSNDDEKRS